MKEFLAILILFLGFILLILGLLIFLGARVEGFGLIIIFPIPIILRGDPLQILLISLMLFMLILLLAYIILRRASAQSYSRV
ncbi:MAG: hypothetical protein QXJ51_03680 [Sulfolobales archaeon]